MHRIRTVLAGILAASSLVSVAAVASASTGVSEARKAYVAPVVPQRKCC